MKYFSRSIGVQPNEAAEANEDMRRAGVTGGEYLTEDRMVNGVRVPAGTFVADSRKAKAQEFRRRGYIDKDAGYGDYAGR
jgi:hypothetical protein